MIRINLLTEKKRKAKKEVAAKAVPRFLIKLILVTVLAIIGAGAVVYYLKSEMSQLQAQSNANKATIAALQKKIDETKRYEKLNKDIQQRTAIIESLRKNQAVPARLLDDVSSLVPEGVWVSSLIFKDNGVSLEGYAFTNIDIVAYVENLKKSGSLTEVSLEESKQAEFEKVPVYRFKLNFKVKV